MFHHFYLWQNAICDINYSYPKVIILIVNGTLHFSILNI